MPEATEPERPFAALALASLRASAARLAEMPEPEKSPVARCSSILDGVENRLQAWVHAEPGITSIEVLTRLMAIDPDRFTDKHLQTVQRAVKRGRMRAAAG
jgi:membrane protein required for beta-lactamase induction